MDEIDQMAGQIATTFSSTDQASRVLLDLPHHLLRRTVIPPAPATGGGSVPRTAAARRSRAP